MNLDEFKLLKVGDSMITLGTISSSKGENGETFIVPAGTTAIVKTGSTYIESIDDWCIICDVEYFPNRWLNKSLKKLGQIGVNPADVLAVASERSERAQPK